MEDYGLLTLAIAIPAVLIVIDCGLSNLMVHRIVSEYVNGSVESLTSLLDTLYTSLYGLGVGGTCVVIFIAVTVPGPFRIPYELLSEARAAILIAGLAILVMLPSTLFIKLLEASGRFDVIGTINTGTSLLRAVGCVVTIESGHGVVAIACVHTGTAVIRLAFLRLIVGRQGIWPRFKPITADWQIVRHLWRPALWAQADNLARQVTLWSGPILLSIWGSLHAAALYGVAARVTGQLSVILSKGADVMMPVIARAEVTSDLREAKDKFLQHCRVGFRVALPIVFASVAFAEPGLRVFAGDRYAAAVPILQCLLLVTLVQTIQMPADVVLYAQRRVALAAICSILEALATILLAALLIERFGGLGLALATLLTYAVSTTAFYFPQACRAVGATTRDISVVFGWGRGA